MMNLLICSATESELTVSKQLIKELNNTSFLVTGVGLTAATYSLCRTIYKQRPDFIIQAGIAGCFDTRLKLNEVVVIEKDCIGDLGVVESDRFQDLFQLGFIGSNEFPWQDQFLVNNHELVKNCGLKVVNSVTVNEISTNDDRICYYRDNGFPARRSSSPSFP